jgi:hypothetical protein
MGRRLVGSSLPEQYKNLIATVAGAGATTFAASGLAVFNNQPHLAQLTDTLNAQQFLQDMSMEGNLAARLLSDSINSVNRENARKFNQRDISYELEDYMETLDQTRKYAKEIFPDQYELARRLVHQEYDISDKDITYIGAGGLSLGYLLYRVYPELRNFLKKWKGSHDAKKQEDAKDGGGGGPPGFPPPPPPPSGSEVKSHDGSDWPLVSESGLRAAANAARIVGAGMSFASGNAAPGLFAQGLSMGLERSISDARRLQTAEEKKQAQALEEAKIAPVVAEARKLFAMLRGQDDPSDLLGYSILSSSLRRLMMDNPSIRPEMIGLPSEWADIREVTASVRGDLARQEAEEKKWEEEMNLPDSDPEEEIPESPIPNRRRPRDDDEEKQRQLALSLLPPPPESDRRRPREDDEVVPGSPKRPRHNEL